MQQEEISIQTLTDNQDIHVGYSDNDVVIIDSIQKFAEVTSAHVSMSAIAICTSGKVQGMMNGQRIELCQNQVAVIPPNVIISDLMISPDFNLKAMFLTSAIIQSFLREKMHVWNELMYIHGLHVISLEGDDMRFYEQFYELLQACFTKPANTPYRTDVVQALLRAAILGLCGALRKEVGNRQQDMVAVNSGNTHFQRFLDLLHSEHVKHRTVESYASELCVSSKYLSVICKKQSGKTANEWITEQVMDDIRYYLRQTDLSLKQVCDQLGFPNPSFFGKYVKAHFGMTPMQLRNTP
ncbi:MAG: helix-turn-helix transcriptional regulator [Prevotella sp.]|nr:helix-turn-helix transcriptional regulator [Prevotella sp.]